jgi:hypothetical protein
MYVQVYVQRQAAGTAVAVAAAEAALAAAIRRIAALPTDEARLAAWQAHWAAASLAGVDPVASAALFQSIMSAARQAEARAGSTAAAAPVAAEHLLNAIAGFSGLISALIRSAQSGPDADAAAVAWSTSAAAISSSGARAQPLQALVVEAAAAAGARLWEVGEVIWLDALVPGMIECASVPCTVSSAAHIQKFQILLLATANTAAWALQSRWDHTMCPCRAVCT